MKVPGGLVVWALCLSTVAFAQDPDRNRDRDTERVTRLEAGTVIPVRPNEAIDRETTVFIQARWLRMFGETTEGC
jgi:hypothetical protein